MTTHMQPDVEAQLEQAREELRLCQEKLLRLLRLCNQPVIQDYIFSGPNNTQVSLSGLFGAHQDLILIHNMGKSCVYCTLWADGLNGFLPHLQDRAAFVVTSPDDPQTQQQFAQQRGWHFTMLSSQGTTFRADMGFQPDGALMPGISIFHKNADGTITHGARDFFGPGDNYCAIWYLFDLLPDSANGWEPKFQYGADL